MRAILRLLCAAILIGSLANAGAAMAEEKPAMEARVESLLAQMTLEEKIGQLIQLSNVGDTTGPLPDDETRRRNMELVKAGMIGSMLNVVGVEEVRIVQDYAVNNSRLGIPLIFGFDVVHGHKTSFPIPLGPPFPMLERLAFCCSLDATGDSC